MALRPTGERSLVSLQSVGDLEVIDDALTGRRAMVALQPVADLALVLRFLGTGAGVGTATGDIDASVTLGGTGEGAGGATGDATLSQEMALTIKTDNLSTGSSNDDQFSLPLISAGTYNFEVDWGDGSSDTITAWNAAAKTHTYDDPGTYEIIITGTIRGWSFNNTGDRLKILNIASWGPLWFIPLGSAHFYGCANLTCSAADAPNLTGVTSLLNCFRACTSFNGAVGNWDVSSVTNLQGTFQGCSVFNQDLNDWDVSNVTDMSSLFSGNTAFNGDISGWDVSSVTNFNNTFKTSGFNGDISGWITSSATNMDSMFDGAASFDQDLSEWDVSNVTLMSKLFVGASVFTSDLSGWDTSSATTMADMFGNARLFTSDLPWDVSNVTTMARMFEGAWAFAGDVSGWQTGNVTDMASLFRDARAFNSDISLWDVSSVTTMGGIFRAAWVFNADISGWDVSSVTNYLNAFRDAFAFDQDLGDWDVSAATNMGSMFANAELSTANYDSLLLGWAELTLQNGVAFDAGSSEYSGGLPADARAYIIATFGWTITDGGGGPISDIIPPVLSAASAVVVSATVASLRVTTDEGNGTIYRVVTASATPPSKAQVKAGQDHTGAAAVAVPASQAVSAVGEYIRLVTGLTAATAYYAYSMHEDAVGNQSDVASSGEFTTSSTIYSDEAVAVFSEWENQPDETRKALYDDELIGPLKAADLWDDIALLQNYAAHDAQAASVNLVDPTGPKAEPKFGPTFTADVGYAGDGAASYVDTGYDPVIQGGFGLDSAFMLVATSSDLTSSTAIDFGNNQSRINPWSSGELVGIRCNDNGGDTPDLDITTSVGVVIWSRVEQPGYKVQKYGGTAVSVSRGSSALQSSRFFAGASSNASNVGQLHSSRTIVLVAAGIGLDDTKRAAMLSIVNDFCIAIGSLEGDDTTAPVLSSPVDTAVSDTTGSASVDTDEDDGTLYWVATTSGTAPTKAQVKAGQDHTGAAAVDSGSQAVSGTGTQAISGGITGLTASTGYFVHFMHEDAATNQSDVASGDGFTTSADYSAEADALFAAMSVQPDETRKALIDTLIGNLKTAGVWTKIRLLYILAAHDAQAARLNWKSVSTFELTAVNSPTFTTDRGYTGDGATSRLNVGYNPATDATIFLPADAHMGIDIGTNVMNSSMLDCGYNNARINTWINTTSVGIRATNNGGDVVDLGVTTSVGHVMWSRRSPDGGDNYYTQKGTGTSVMTVRGEVDPHVSGTMSILASATGGHSTRRARAFHIGGGLTDAEMDAVATAVATYMTAIGA